MIEEYSNYISLGYFCGVAGDLEKLGLRSTSSPFDWCEASFIKCIELIDTGFNDFMRYDHLLQSTKNREIYMDEEYDFFFFHDFSKYIPLKDQYDQVKEKYDRRISRFLKNIEKPTLFFRYICNDQLDRVSVERYNELSWIEENQQYILDVLRKYNKKNDIVYIGDDQVRSDKIRIYHTPIDKGDVVSRKPIIHNPELYPIARKYKLEGREDNLKRCRAKEREKNNIVKKGGRALTMLRRQVFEKEYVHSRQESIK